MEMFDQIRRSPTRSLSCLLSFFRSLSLSPLIFLTITNDLPSLPIVLVLSTISQALSFPKQGSKKQKKSKRQPVNVSLAISTQTAHLLPPSEDP